MNISINLNTVFRGAEADPQASLQTLRSYGFDWFECWRIAPADIPALQEAVAQSGLRMAACCPDHFILNDPAERDAYEDSILQSLPVLRGFGCGKLITQVGQSTAAPRKDQHDAIIDGLRRVVPHLEKAGVTLLVEPLNDVKNHPGYYLTSSDEGFAIVEAVNSPHVRLLYDLYHQLHMGEDVLAQISGHFPLIGHYHVAGFPNRDERIFDGFDYRSFFALLQKNNITAHIGIELIPSTPDARPPLLTALQAYL